MIGDLIFSGAVGAIIGSIIGAIVGAYAQYLFSNNALKRTARERDQTIYKMLHREISQNLEWMKTYWREKVQHAFPPVRGPSPHGYSADELQFLYRFNLVQEPLPAWNQQIWESQRITLSSILTDEPFREVSNHYTTLARLATLRDKLTSALPQDFTQHFLKVVTTDYAELQKDAALQWSLFNIAIVEEPSNSPKILTYEEALRGHVNGTFELWAECEGIFNGMPSRGNPLPEEMPQPAHGLRIRARLVARIKHPLRRKEGITVAPIRNNK